MDDHYGVSCCLSKATHPSGVLAQIQEGTTYGYPVVQQARIRLTPEEARHFAQLLLEMADRVEAHLATLPGTTED